jgi:hypothetical protein
VTAERMGASYNAPHIALVKRADHLITDVRVTCDTRDAGQRVTELKQTLRNLMKAAAGSPTISLGLGEKTLGDLMESNFSEIITTDSRSDTSAADIVIKTKVSKDDNINTAIARVLAFIQNTPKVGRTEVIRQGEWGLTVIGPDQYHDQIVTMIVADAKHIAETFGPHYGVNIEGLEHPVSWYQKGPLDLGLYVEYDMKIAPTGI